jgi:NADPH-dependent ferric siderophore reductase
MDATTDRGMGRRLIGQFFRTGEVTAVDQITARMRRITLAVPELDWMPGQQVRVCVGDVTSPADWLNGLRRSYSIWEYAGGLLRLCVLEHSPAGSAGPDGPAGPGARWARSLAVGQQVLFSPPEGAMVVRSAPYHVFVGEETAAVAFGAMLSALPDADVRGVIEVDSPADRLPLARELTWRYRDGAPAASSATLTAAVAELDLPPEPGAAYVAGEARTVQAVCQHLIRDRGWPRRAVRSKPFWTPGKTGMD